MYDLPFRKGYKSQFTKEVSEIVATSSKKPPTYTIKHEQDEIIRGKLYQKEFNQSHLTMESFTVELVSNASAQLSPDNTLRFFRNFLPEQLNLDGQWEVEISEKSYQQCTEMLRRENLCFLKRNFQSHQNSITWNLVVTPPLRMLLKP